MALKRVDGFAFREFDVGIGFDGNFYIAVGRDDVESRIARLMRALESISEWTRKILRLIGELQGGDTQVRVLAEAQLPKPAVTAPCADAVTRYRELVGELGRHVGSPIADDRVELATATRSLIEKVIVYPWSRTDKDVELIGDLASLVGGSEAPMSGMEAMVAGAGLSRSHTSLKPVTPIDEERTQTRAIEASIRAAQRALAAHQKALATDRTRWDSSVSSTGDLQSLATELTQIARELNERIAASGP